MKRLPLLLAMLASAFAAEPVELPLAIGTLKLRDGTVYEEAKVVGQDAVGLKIMHAGGTARLPFAKLPKELADRFPRDTEAAKKQLEKEAKDATAHERSVDKAVTKQKEKAGDEEEGEDKDSPLENAPEAEGDNRAKIVALEAYIERMEDGIEETKEDVAKTLQRASESRSNAVTTVTRVDSQGQMISETRSNSSKIRKAEYLERRARKLDAKIAEAQRLIERAQERIKILEGAG